VSCEAGHVGEASSPDQPPPRIARAGQRSQRAPGDSTVVERREFVVKQRVVDPVQPISVEQNRGRSARVGCCRLDHCHCTVCSTRPAHRIAQDIAQHGGQALHLELELKG